MICKTCDVRYSDIPKNFYFDSCNNVFKRKCKKCCSIYGSNKTRYSREGKSFVRKSERLYEYREISGSELSNLKKIVAKMTNKFEWEENNDGWVYSKEREYYRKLYPNGYNYKNELGWENSSERNSYINAGLMSKNN